MVPKTIQKQDQLTYGIESQYKLQNMSWEKITILARIVAFGFAFLLMYINF